LHADNILEIKTVEYQDTQSALCLSVKNCIRIRSFDMFYFLNILEQYLYVENLIYFGVLMKIELIIRIFNQNWKWLY